MAVTAKSSIVCALLVAAAPAAAEPYVVRARAPDVTGQSAKSQPRQVIVPGYGAVYVVPEQAKDTRTPRQRCIDEEVARERGFPSELAMGAIDLKCSQR